MSITNLAIRPLHTLFVVSGFEAIGLCGNGGEIALPSRFSYEKPYQSSNQQQEGKVDEGEGDIESGPRDTLLTLVHGA